MTVLFLVMEFPPMNSGGVFRPLRFIKGLNDHGITPVVVTFEIDDFLKRVHAKFDEQLLQQVPAGVPVYRIPLEDLSTFYSSRLRRFRNTYFNVSDNYVAAWRRNLFSHLPRIIGKHRPELILATAPPFGGAVLATEVSKKFRLPLVLDMRDAWALLSMAPLGSYFHYLAKRNLECRSFRQASAVITVTPQLKKMFQKTHPGIPHEKFHLIYNTLDFELPERLEVHSAGIKEEKKFHIGYVGSFYFSPEGHEMMSRPWWKKKGHRMLQYLPVKEDWMYRSPWFFFRALKQLLDKHPEWKSRLFFHHVGETPAWLPGMAEKAGVRDNLVLHGFQPLQQTLALQASFDALLATSEKVIGDEHYCLPSKLFTYLRSGKPVLAFLTKGIQHEFIRNSKVGLIADPDDVNQGVAVMEDLLMRGYSASLDLHYLRRFERGKAIEQLLHLVHQTAAQNKNTEKPVAI